MKKKSLPARRNSYYYLDGDKKYPSITSVLNVLAKPALLYWYGQQAARIALDDPTLSEKEVMAELQRYVKSTQRRGTEVHKHAELLLTGGRLPIEFPPHIAGFLNALQSWYTAFSPVTVMNEETVWSDSLKVAGRFDAVVKINDEVWLIDVKTSSKGAVYPEVGLQLAAYRYCIHEMGLCKVDRCGVVALADDGEYTFREMKASIEDFKHVLGAWLWSKRKE